MMRLLASVIYVIAMQGTVADAQPQLNDESAIRAVVKTYLDARERRDAQALGALFLEDADQLVSSGEWRKGRDAIVRGTLASSAGSPGARTISIQSVRFPLADVALADGPYELAGGQGGETRKMWTSFVLVRSSGAWKIASIRNMLPSQSNP